jgi:hypothetical protein
VPQRTDNPRTPRSSPVPNPQNRTRGEVPAQILSVERARRSPLGCDFAGRFPARPDTDEKCDLRRRLCSDQHRAQRGDRVPPSRRRLAGTIGSVATGGDGSPHLQSQGSVALTGNGQHLLVTNAASDDLSVFAVAADGLLRLRDRVHTGTAPGSVAERDGLYSPLIRRERFRCRGGVPKGQERSSEYSGEEWAAGNEEELCGYGRPAANPISAAPKADAVTLRPAPMVKT